MSDPVVIVGGGLAAGAAVQTLREEGEDGPIVLIGAERHLPYERPPLSKQYLRGEADAAALPLHEDASYEEWGIDARIGVRATGLDVADRTVELEGGSTVGYRVLLLATGGRARILGAEPSDRVCYLRTVEDADRLRRHLGGGKHLLVVGAGFIGSEVAASARAIGTDVTMIERAASPLNRVLGEGMGRVLAEIHRERGVDLRLETGLTEVRETGESVIVETDEGDALEGDAVVIGAGIIPNTELAEAAGLEIDNGIAVDARCAASAEGVFAAGDVAAHDHPVFGRIRVEHFDNALKMGAHAAKAMLGSPEPFDDAHWFWSDQYDVNLQMGGFAATWDEIVVRGSIEDRDFTAFYMKDGMVRSVLSIGRPRDVRRGMKVISAQVHPDVEALRDDDVDVGSLLPGA
ncbi:MAG TPA: FAD-dependent oxidoreductase [Actinomycetota bacterium]